MARVVGHGMTRKFTEREDRRIGARGLTRRREGHEGFFGLARVVGHGMTRKFTEREIWEFARVGFTTEDTEGAKDFLGWRMSWATE
jgi:hypothetical protein